jgi:hypothetical protein
MTRTGARNIATRLPARMPHALGRFAIGVFILTLVSCVSPVLVERAVDPPGWSGGVAVEAARAWKPMIVDDEVDEMETFVAPVGTIHWRSSDRFTHTLSVGYGLDFASLNASSIRDVDTLVRGSVLDLRLSEKLRVFQHGALRLTAGALFFSNWGLFRNLREPMVDLCYLHDFNGFLTGSLGVGCSLTRSLSLGVGYPALVSLGVLVHPRIS